MFRPKRIIVLLLISFLLAGTFVMAGCSSEADTLDTINASYVTRPINIPTIAARDLGMFENEFAGDGITFIWHDIPVPSNQLEALASKSLDFANSLNYVSVLLSKAAGNDIIVISSYSRFPQGIALVVSSDSQIDTVADLRGKKIALQIGTMLHEMLIHALAGEGMTVADLELINMDSADSFAALSAGQVDAAILPEPLLSRAMASGTMKELFTAEGLIPGLAMIVVRGEFARNNPDAVKRYLQVHAASLDWIQENQEAAFEMAARETQMEPRAVEALYTKFDFGMSLEHVKEELLIAADFLQQEGMIRADVDLDKLVDDLVDPSFLP